MNDDDLAALLLVTSRCRCEHRRLFRASVINEIPRDAPLREVRSDDD